MINVFYHVFREGAFWPLLVNDQLSRMVTSGLYDKATTIHINAVGPGQSLSWLKADYPKVTFTESPINNFELGTIQALQDFCKAHPDELVLYLHTKGITNKQTKTRDWRHLMEHFCIDRWERCVELLTKYERSTVGVNLHLKPRPHYSGNFWWSTTNHINNLAPIDTRDRMNAEFFILSDDAARATSFYESGINHYERNYPAHNYEHLQDVTCLQETQKLVHAEYSLNGGVPPDLLTFP